MDKRRTISQSPIFNGLKGRPLEEVAGIAQARKAGRGEMIFQEGEKARIFYILAEGAVELKKITAEGRETLIRQVEKGETFAEAAMFSGDAYPVTAIATASSVLLSIEKERFLRLLRSHPEVSLAIMGAMARLLRHWNTLLEELSLTSVESRLAAWMQKRLRDAGGASFRLGIQKRELARRLGTVPETLSRNLRKLSDAGIIEISGDKLFVNDPEGLADISGR